ncbi:hypothetical protein Hypma_014400 [Hypsizygus marmoreus]|uniref:F-box domain-containing protein n=1 Tax=Hypsizygus marmoreus TaxID=39966 RepID=A0A369JAE5_HYPMA|nr:hypothetical protein Hypma_014400 [Hypsizygus marmoreus]
MQSSSNLPQELLDKIIDDIHDEKEILKHCALTSRCLLHCSQSHLFSSIRLSNDTLVHRLHDVLTDNPIISKHVHELELNPRHWIISSETSLVPLLRMFTSLKSLKVAAPGHVHLTWNSEIPQMTTNAIMYLLNLPSFIIFEVFMMLNVPLGLFTVRQHMKSLRFKNVTFAPFVGSDIPEMTAEQLRLNMWHAEFCVDQHSVALLTRPGALFAQIEVLIIERPKHGPRLVSQIFNASAHSLRTIELCSIFEDRLVDPRGSYPIFDFGSMPNLSHVILRATISNSTPSVFKLEYDTALTDFRHFLSANCSVARIPRLTFAIRGVHYNRLAAPLWPLSILPMLNLFSQWAVIDRVLDQCRGTMKTPFCLEIMLDMYGRIPLDEVHGSQAAWVSGVSSQMPLTSKKGELVCKITRSP